MRLARLIAELKTAAVSGLSGEGPEVGSLHYRSQEVRPGGDIWRFLLRGS